MQFCPAFIDIFRLGSTVLLSALLSNAVNLFSLSTVEHSRPHKTDRIANTGILCVFKEELETFRGQLTEKNCQVEHDIYKVNRQVEHDIIK
jgi:hypothetical protein